jgi:hypothetical protein
MTFQIVRNSDPVCEPTCPEWVYATGVIDRGTPSKFRRLVKTLKGARVPIVFNSYGGDILAALELGQEIRKGKFDTAIGNTETQPCRTEKKTCGEKGPKFGSINNSSAYCDSACAYAFARGIQRSSTDKNYIRVHRGSPITYKNKGNKWVDLKDKDRISKIDIEASRQIRTNMKNFGVKDGFVEFVYEHSELYIAPFDLLVGFELINHIGVQDLFKPTSCSTDKSPNYCVDRPN